MGEGGGIIFSNKQGEVRDCTFRTTICLKLLSIRISSALSEEGKVCSQQTYENKN